MRSTPHAPTSAPIAVIGMSLRVPGATTLDRYWRNLVEGRDCLTRLSADALRRAGVAQDILAHPDFVRALPSLDDVERFDAEFFGLSGREAELTDPSHRLFLECAWESLESAGVIPGRRGPVTGVFGGCEGNYQQRVLKPIDDPRRFPGVSLPIRLGNAIDFLTTRVSHRLDLTGPSCSVMAACATSLMAVDLAIQSLRRGECEVALAGGATVMLPRVGGYMAGIEGMFSPTGRIRPFDASADGTIFGSGAGVVALRPLADALAAGNPVHAVILGSASSNDGHPPGKESFIAPSPEGQIAAIAAALADARVSPQTIGYLEAHGTGTRLGDPVEVAALAEVYRRANGARAWCALGSVKANVGHLRTAAGVASLIKACLALERRTLPPLANFERPNPRIDFASGPFTVPTKACAWDAGGSPRRAAVSSFGFGGSNVHVVLEEHRETAARPSRRRTHLLCVSARSEAALARRVEALGAHLDEHPELPAADVAHTLLHGRPAMALRACHIVSESTPAGAALAAGRPIASGTASVEPGEVVFLFPGQGAAIRGAGRALYEREPVYRDTIDECADALATALGRDLRELLGYAGGGGEQAQLVAGLRRTACAQPALFAIEIAAARLFRSWGVRPAAMLGHSLGELAAACSAGVFALPDALAVVAARGRLMQACEPGAMAAVFLPEDELAARLPPDLEIAAVNAPGVCVVCGPEDRVADGCAILAGQGVGTQRLDTSHAFHSRMMEPALAEFEQVVAGVPLSAPSIPVISNATGLPLTAAQATSPRYWAEHIRRPVRWSAGVRHALALPRPVFVELGPGSAMGELVRRHDATAIVHASMPATPARVDGATDAQAALAGLWCAGVEVSAPGDGERRDFVRLPTYPFERTRHWLDDEHAPPPDPRRALHERGFRAAPLTDIAVAAPLADRPWIVFGEDRPLADALVARLAASGASVVRAIASQAHEPAGPGRLRIRPDAREDWGAVFAAAAALGAPRPACVLHLGGVSGAGGPHNTAAAFESAARTGFHSLVALAQAVFDRGEGPGTEVLVVADALAVLDGEPGEPHAEKAAALGAARVIPREIPGLSMRTVDIPCTENANFPEAVVDALVREACATRDLSPAPALVVLRGASRHVETIYALPDLAQSGPRLRERGVVLITGGTGGLGLLFAGVLHEQSRARLVLTARWTPPPESEWPERARRDDRIGRALAGVLALREQGAEVAIVTADVARREDVAHAIAATRARYGGLHGVVHAAGELRPTPVVHKTREDAARVFGGKVLGAMHLEELLGDQPLDLCVQLSSMASQFPEAGQVDYAAANAVLDALAVRRAARHRGLSCATGWGPWQDVGMAVDRLRTTLAVEAERAQAREDDAGDAMPLDHPVWRTRTREPGGDIVYRGVLKRGHWLVEDHLLDGRPLLSGTTVVQLVYSAYVDHAPGAAAVELTSVAFQRPLYTADVGTRIELRFSPQRAGERYTLRSRPLTPDGEWEENSTGYAQRRAVEPGPVPAPPPDSAWRDVPARSRFEGRHLSGRGRWNLVRRELECDGRIWCRVSLPPEFGTDLAAFPLHPAVLDAAGIVGSRGVAGEAVPHTYDCVRVHAPLVAESVLLTRMRSSGTASVSDAVFVDVDGRVAVEIEGYVMKPYEGSSLDEEGRRSHGHAGGAGAAEARRVVVTEPGDLDSIRIEPFTPREPGPGEVRIAVRAAALNFRDVLTALGQMGPVPGGRLAPGGECSGIVAAVGPGVRRFAIGDAVVAIAPSTLATHTTVAEHSVAMMPSNLDFERAAGLPIVFLTAVHALENLARLKRGERVLIHAGAGGVGLAAIQIAQAIGAEIHATAGSPDKREYLRSLGVAHVHDSRSLAFADGVRAATGGEGVDVVLNSLAGEFLTASLDLLRPQGRFVEIGKRDLLAGTPLGLAPFLRNLTFSAFDLGRIVESRDPMLPAMFDELMDRFARGALKPAPTQVVPLDRAADGFRRMARAQHVGKIVFQVRADATQADGLARAFEDSYGTGVPVEWGLDVFARLLRWTEAPRYLLAMGVAAPGLGKVALRPRVVASDARGRERLKSEYRAPRDPVEEALVRLWEKTLGVSPIGVDDDFLDLGGDSIEAIQIQHAIHREFDLRIKNTEFLAGPTIAAIAALIAGKPVGG